MTDKNERPEVDQFILEHIDSVPHLEALLLLWNKRPRMWPVDEMAKALFITADAAKDILQSLVRRHLIVADDVVPETYRYESDPEKDRLIALVDATYRRELIRVSTLIHSKPPTAIREFARAFRFKKERE